MPSLEPPIATAPPGSRGSAGGFLAVQVMFLAAAHVLGGPPWVALGVLACLGQIAADFRLASLLRLVPALAWAIAHAMTGNRELFFPFAIYLAAHAVTVWPPGRGLAGGAAIVGGFLVIRFLQQATPRVLAVELAVAAVIMAATVAGGASARGRPWVTWIIPPAASLAAYVGLAL